jgi:hypothetical protein
MCAERRAPTQDTGAALASACAALKILPLPGVTIFPGAPLPLRIFEPRYRALVGEALATDRILAIPMLVSEEAASQSRAEIHPIAGAVRPTSASRASAPSVASMNVAAASHSSDVRASPWIAATSASHPQPTPLAV